MGHFEQDYRQSYGISEAQVSNALSDVMRRVYMLMSLGLGITGVTAWFSFQSGLLASLYGTLPYASLILFGVEILLVMAIGRSIGKISPAASTGLFLFYSLVNGFTMAFIFYTYTLGSIGVVFLITAGMFAGMSVIGFTTKTNMSQYRSYFMMGLIGFIIASVVNIFLGSSLLYWGLTYFGVALFLGLTIYDTQKIKQMTIDSLNNGGQATMLSRIAIMGALSLYLDFINLFILLLRIFGDRD